MKKSNLKIILAALLFAVGTLGLSAQGVRGGGNGGMGGGNGMGGTGTGSCNYLSLLTDAQKAELQVINDAFQADMLEIATARQAATTLAEKIDLFNQMNALREQHIIDVKAYLTSIGITVTTGTGTRGSGMTGKGRHGRRG